MEIKQKEFFLFCILRIFIRFMKSPRSIAIVHDWLVGMRGGEKVLEVVCELFPDAVLWTLVHQKGNLSPTIESMDIRTSFIQKIPFGRHKYQYFLPLYPAAIRKFDLQEFDLIISISHAAAKAVRPRKDVLHICYCHTPMRYIWDQYDDYFGKGKSSFVARTAMKMCVEYLRRWDIESVNGVDYFIANSNNVQERIRRIYRRDSTVMYPPVDVDRFSVSNKDSGYYLIVSALVPYKRIDLAIEAFNELGERLVIIGTGEERKRLQVGARSNIEFLGWVDDDRLAEYYAGCRALIFPGEEDFGIVPLEAMASGKPVIAFAKGGALETVVDGKTGILFSEQTRESLMGAVQRFTQMTFDGTAIRSHVERFDRKLFKEQLLLYIQERWGKYHPMSARRLASK